MTRLIAAAGWLLVAAMVAWWWRGNDPAYEAGFADGESQAAGA